MPNEGEERLHVHVDAELKQVLREADGTLRDAVSEALRGYYGVDFSTEAAYRREIERLESELSTIDEEIAQLKESRAQVSDRLAQTRDAHEEFVQSQVEYAHRLDTILCELLHNDLNTVFGRRAKLREAALEEYGHQGSEAVQNVIDDIRDRAHDRGMVLPPGVFTESGNVAMATDGKGDAEAELLRTLEGGEDE